MPFTKKQKEQKRSFGDGWSIRDNILDIKNGFIEYPSTKGAYF
jgi:hypothetical protein